MQSDLCPVPGNGSLPGYDNERISRIREQFCLVFERESRMSNSQLERRYTLTDSGELVMIL